MPNHKTNIVVIDDEPAVLETLQMLLEFLDYGVIAAPSAEAALTMLQQTGFVPHLVLADYRLADDKVGTDGIRLIRQAVGMAIPGIIITGDTSPERIKEANDSGFRILHKPAQVETLKAAIEAALGGGREPEEPV
jgi:two-component system CheB/CheR fusion protein